MLNKINTEILNACKELYEFVNTDHVEEFDTRGKYLVSNIKYRGFLTGEDVLKLAPNLPNDAELELLEEFDDTRLNGIMDHCAQDAIESFKDEYGGKDQLQERGHKSPYGRFANAVYTINGDADDVSTQGNGGWLSYAPKSVIEFSYNENDETICADAIVENPTESNKRFDELIEDHLTRVYYQYKGEERKRIEVGTYKAKKNLVAYLKGAKEDLEAKVEACRTIDKYIRQRADEFISDCIEQLKEEIGDFLTSSKEVNATIWIDGDRVVTSMGASVPKASAVKVLSMLEFKGNSIKFQDGDDRGFKVGAFRVDSAWRAGDDWIVKVGCHRLSLQHVRNAILV